MVATASAMMVWKAKACMDPIGSILFATKSSDQEKTISTMSMQNLKAKIIAPENGILASNFIVRK